MRKPRESRLQPKSGSGQGREKAIGSWLFAADGARSAVRKSLGVPFDERPYETRVLRIMTRQDMDSVVSRNCAAQLHLPR